MLHEPAPPTGFDPALAYKKRLGLWMMLIYSVIYGGFVLINLLKPEAMETVLFAGINLAVFYGFGLIAIALILSLVYAVLCTRKEGE